MKYQVFFSVLLIFNVAKIEVSFSQDNNNNYYTGNIILPENEENDIDKSNLTFLGNGDIQKSLAQDQPLNANTGLGVAFERYRGFYNRIGGNIMQRAIDYVSFDLVINVASTADTIYAKLDPGGQVINTRDYGAYILNPITSGQAVTFNGKISFTRVTDHHSINGDSTHWFNNVTGVINGIQLKFIGSNRLWEINGTTKNITGLAGRIGVYYELFPTQHRYDEDFKEQYSATIGLNYSFRSILGDFAATQYDTLRSKFLNDNNARLYQGPEFNIALKIKNIIAEVSLPYMYGGDRNIDGLSRWQFFTSIRFIGGFPIKLN